ncbi:MAG: DsbA family oxidoreductase [Rhodobiaceae bacterium]|jgi:predicted DsbA family dithiol-disulfide isomerase|nr:DsbA family oxidoreductase [Rhodobiaceae bacterium]MBT7279347.1 DsbA family oxidoreductase [Rhodobiaceae bacterium]
MSDPQATPAPVMQLDVISDVICPWCFIGKRKLDAALAQVDDFQINLMWRPFQLDPTTPPEGHDRKQQMIRKFGPDAGKQIFKNVLAAAEGTGINWNFDKITRTPNTLNAHRLIRWAASTGEQHQIAEALFCAYFEQALDIGDVAVLLDIGEKHGLERDLLVDLFASDRDMEQTRNDDAAARELGVTGVPAFLAGGKFMLMGAQEPEYLNLFLNKARQKLAVQ